MLQKCVQDFKNKSHYLSKTKKHSVVCPLFAMTSLIIDNRERWVSVEDFELVSCKMEALELGDFLICVSDAPFAYIERKTIADLTQSIKDGRYKDQLARYKCVIKENNVNVIYVIEGVSNLRDLLMNPYSTNKSLHSACTNIMFRDRIPVVFCKTKDDTKSFVLDLVKKITQHPEKYKVVAPEEEIESHHIVHNTKKNGEITPERLLANMIACIPGVSVQTAMDVLMAYDMPMTMEELTSRVRADVAKIHELKTKRGRKVSRSVIQSILQTIYHQKV